jgi:hypothetical protein
VVLHLIAEDLDGHLWYEELVDGTVADVEACAPRWAAFEELVAALGETEPEGRSSY